MASPTFDFDALSAAADYFERFLVAPLPRHEETVRDVLGVLERHPLARDENAQDVFARPDEPRRRSDADRVPVWLENQSTFTCFVAERDALNVHAPVSFASALDLVVDHGVAASEVQADGSCLVATSFVRFVWFALGFHLVLRAERPSEPSLRDDVCGIVFDGPIGDLIRQEWVHPLTREFPTGYTPVFSNDGVCIPEWGAAFVSREARDEFVRRYRPRVRSEW